ncbi:hypothetical protein ABIA70_001132 [Arthrobacter sp. 754]
MMALVVVSVIFLRWLPHHGFPVLLPFGVAIAAAAGIYLNQSQRYRSGSEGITRERIDADIAGVFLTAFPCAAIGALGTGVVLAAG